jgi:hypothetical protein
LGAGPATKAWRTALLPFLNFLALLVGLAAGVAQLAGLFSGIGRFVLTAVAITCLLFVLLRYWQLYFIAKNQELRSHIAAETTKLASISRDHQQYVDAIERIIDREKTLFSETLEVTIWVGVDDEGDRIVEKRITVPTPLVTNRMIQPIVPTDAEVMMIDDINLKARSATGEITSLPLREQRNLLRLWLIFDPPMTEPTEWEVEYRPRALWRSLRAFGSEVLVWHEATTLPRERRPELTKLVVHFKFPAAEHPPTVRERDGYGQCAEATLDSDGRWDVTWRDTDPSERSYSWDVHQAVVNTLP